jgi:hypothetical protein
MATPPDVRFDCTHSRLPASVRVDETVLVVPVVVLVQATSHRFGQTCAVVPKRQASVPESRGGKPEQSA